MDTAYALRDAAVQREREELVLGASTSLFTPMLLEPVLPYDGVADLSAAAATAGLQSDVLSAVGSALFGPAAVKAGRVSLRAHQVSALRAHFSAEGARNVVVTSGTGSGKTEAFLLPLLTRIAQDAQRSPGLPVPHEWWSVAEQNSSWATVRRATKRIPAVRGLILYPTNALVEDQMSRLRRAVRRLRADAGYDLWFGRYTGATPGSGAVPSRGSRPPAGLVGGCRPPVCSADVHGAERAGRRRRAC